MLLCDTGVLLAAGNIKDRAHQACVGLLRQAEGPLLVPSPVLGEIGYLLQSRVGPGQKLPSSSRSAATASTSPNWMTKTSGGWPSWWRPTWTCRWASLMLR